MTAGVVDDIHSKLTLANVVVIEWGTAAKTAVVINQLLNGGLDRVTWSAIFCVLHKCADGVLLGVVLVALDATDLLAVVVLRVVRDALASLL